MSVNRRTVAAVVSVLAFGLLASGCFPAATVTGHTSPTVAAVTAECDAAFATASDGMNDHYDMHPMYGPEYDALYADGTIDDDEQTRLDEMIRDEEAQYNAVIDPVFDACTGWEDLYAGAFANRSAADWGLEDNEYTTRDQARTNFVTAYCIGNEDRPACEDFDIADW